MGRKSSAGKRGVPRKASNSNRKAKYQRYTVNGGRGERNATRRLERHIKTNPLDNQAKEALKKVQKYGLSQRP